MAKDARPCLVEPGSPFAMQFPALKEDLVGHDPDDPEDEEFDGTAYLSGRYREHDGAFAVDQTEFFDVWAPRRCPSSV